ncbi:glycosyltransferase [Nocardioides sp. LS1]|uniref:glycosyltransferase family protein n=1 Tax=Nocardioides sp. LS1 TaxID=1027620 RepID=UPI000F61F08A|nr:glycosyltransferase [Nocardioides sp. LS1]GCD90328.1 hypothetical protein NLS1_23340 [Nocardioides sp. LS1]
MPSAAEDAAIALVVESRLFDPDWYAAQAGRTFGSRAEAAVHWVTEQDAELSPHPLFEPRWIYPGGKWRKKAPDPLSFYLGSPHERTRSPHPLVDIEETGPLEEWLADHDPAELLPDLPRSPVADVVVRVEVADPARAVGWARHLARFHPDATALLVTDGVAATRVLRSVAGGLPSVRVVAPTELVPAPVVVDVRPSVNAPRWPWLDDLVAALDRDGVAAAQPLLLAPDFTVAAAGAAYTSKGVAPLLAGHPTGDAERLDGLALPAPWPGVLARREGADGDTVLVASSRVVQPREDGPPSEQATAARVSSTQQLLGRAGYDASGEPIRVVEGRPALRWALDIAAPAGIGGHWGDLHFARSLGDALGRLGQWVTVDHPETRGRASRSTDDVVLTIRGLDAVTPQPGPVNLLWVISHPEDVTAAECAAYDVAFAAGTAWAAHRSREWGLPITPLLQCTDPTRFHPGLADPDTGPRLLFVGGSRGVLRPVVAAARETGADLTLYGTGWAEWWPDVAGTSVPNEELGRLYAGAGLVLNDHWEDMRTEGFVSNRVFDALACGARLLSDDVAGLSDVVGDSVPVFRDVDDFRRLATGDFERHYPDADARLATAHRVVAEHSFDARAATLLDAALRQRAARS